MSISPLLFLVGASIIRTRIKKIHDEAILNLKNPTLLSQYINIITSSLAKR